MGAPSCMYLTAPMSATVCSVPLSRIYSLKIALTKPWSSHELRTAFEQRVRESANRLGYRYLQSDVEERCLTYGQLATNAHELAAVIRKHISPGQRVVLLYPAGLQFIQAFFACLLANVVAVPLPIPKPNDTAHRLDHVLKDCEPAAIFTETGFLGHISALLPDAYQGAIAATDGNFDCARIVQSLIVSEPDVAVLQYTSGSTSKPKGVVLCNANIFANLRQIEVAFGHTCESSGVIWLPHYHDMGLIGGILQPLFAGFPVTLLSPSHLFSDRYDGCRPFTSTGRLPAEVLTSPTTSASRRPRASNRISI